MIIYSVAVTVKKEIEAAWLKWMREVHIIDVMKTGYFLNWKLQKLILPENLQTESKYVVNYYLESLDLYYQYLKNEFPRLQKEHIDKFSGKFEASREIYVEV